MNQASKMSAIMKNLALSIFRDPTRAPSSEAALAALLLAHVAWNRALGLDSKDYSKLLMVFSRKNPNFWSEFRLRDAEALIDTLRQAKAEHYPMDRRVIVVCGMREGNVHVEWRKE